MNIKSIAFIFVIFLFTSQACEKMINEPKEFRGKKWGADISEFTDMVKAGDLDGIQRYSKNNDKLNIGEAVLDEIKYDFYKGKFYAVRIKIYDRESFDKIRETLSENYGYKDSKTEGDQEYIWDWSNINIKLTSSSLSFWLKYTYKPVLKEIEADKKLKAKSGINDL